MNNQLRFLTKDFALMNDEQLKNISEWQQAVIEEHYSICRHYDNIFFPDFSAISFCWIPGEKKIYASCISYTLEELNKIATWVENNTTEEELTSDLSSPLNRAVFHIKNKE